MHVDIRLGSVFLGQTASLQVYSIALVVSNLVDFLSGMTWQAIRDLEDPELKRLAEALLDTVLRARAETTTKKYTSAYIRWRRWAAQFQGVHSYPVSVAHFILYLQHVVETSQSRSAVVEATNAIAWVQQLAGDKPVSQDS